MRRPLIQLLALWLLAAAAVASAQQRASSVPWSRLESQEFKASLTTERWQSRARWFPAQALPAGYGKYLADGGMTIHSLGQVVAVRCFVPTVRNGQAGLEVQEHVRLRAAPASCDTTSGKACTAYKQTLDLLADRFILAPVTRCSLHRAAAQGVLASTPGDSTAAYRAGMASMVTSCGDKYSRYFTPEEWVLDRRSTAGHGVVGVGVVLRQNGSRVVIEETYRGAPAFGQLRPGDIILSVDGQAVETVDQVRSRVIGTAGTPVTVRVLRQGSELNFNLSRADYRAPATREPTLEAGGIGVIKLTKFTEGSANDVRLAIRQLRRQNRGELKGLVLDLRGNGGGLVSEARRLLNTFVPSGTFFRGVERASSESFGARWLDGGYPRLPLAVLVDGDTASSSEIVSGVLKNLGRATLFGDKTFGKGIWQTPYHLADGSGVLITTGRLLLPDGRGGEVGYHGEGIAPHVTVEEARRILGDAGQAEDPALQCAVRFLQRQAAQGHR
jgi:C-terminal peptidase prc